MSSGTSHSSSTPYSLEQQSLGQQAYNNTNFQSGLADYASGKNRDLNSLISQASNSNPATTKAVQGFGDAGPMKGMDLAKWAGGAQGMLSKDYNYQNAIQPSVFAQEFKNALATDPTTAGIFASEQVRSDPTFSKVYGQGGEYDKSLGQIDKYRSNEANQLGRINKLQDQGYQLTPGDNSMYGQAAGNVTRQFGQQGNQAAASLRARGLGNSGAAGATFSGLAGNQNEMLAKAQQDIMQQRFANTQQQLGQMQSLYSTQAGQTQQQQDYTKGQTQDFGNLKASQEQSNLAGVNTFKNNQNSNINNDLQNQGLYLNQENENNAAANAAINTGVGLATSWMPFAGGAAGGKK